MLSFLSHKRNRRALALLLAAALALSPLSAIAETYYIEDGGITVTNDGSGQTVTQNGTDHVETTETVITNRDPSTASANTVTLDADEGAKVEVTIQDLHINVSNAAVTTTGDGDVVIELDGNSTLTAGDHHAGLQKENGGTLTIKDQDDDGSLTATGGFGSAGIGGSCYGSSSDIKISGNAVVAVAGGTYEQAFGNADPDVTELSCPGHIDYYASGTTAEQIQIQQVQPTDKCYASQGHTPGTPQKENEIAGDCTTDHEYDLVTYCTVCGAKLSTDHVNTGNVHTPGEAVKENEVAATDFTEGSYDSVVYCSVCHEELSRKAVTVPALLDPFTQFCLTLARRIRTAPENGTVEADAGLWPGLQRVVFEALADRPNVTLKIVCRLDGAATELTLPAGMDLLEKIGDARMTTFADLAKLLA